VAGIGSVIGPSIPLTGGLAGDGADFKETLVGGDCVPRPRTIAADRLLRRRHSVGHGSAGGWDLFGPRRKVTRSVGNVLSNSDGERRSTFTSAISGQRNQRAAELSFAVPVQVYDMRGPIPRSFARCWRSIARRRSMTFAGDVSAGLDGAMMRRKT